MQRLALALVMSVAACGSKPSADGAASAGSGSGSAVAAAGSGSGSGSGSAAPAAAPTTATPTALVQQWGAANLHVAADSVRVAPFAVKASGVELYWVSDGRPAAEESGDDDARLVGVTGGASGQIVEDRELLLAVIAGKPAPKDLARIALAVGQREGEVLDKADGPEQQKAKVTAPAIAGNALSFWVYTQEVPRGLEHGELDLTTGLLKTTPPAMPDAQLIARAIATLEGPSVKRHAAAVAVLADHCKDAKALQELTHAVAGHPRVKTRVAVTEQIHHCGSPAVAALTAALDEDKSSQVRQGAAIALGRIGDGKARAALAKASRSEDANLAYAAKQALAKLK